MMTDFKKPQGQQQRQAIRKEVLGANHTPATKARTKRAEESERANGVVNTVQTAMEASFFHNQPVSVKQTADTITERMTSNLVGQIMRTLIPKDAEIVMAKLGQELINNIQAVNLTADDAATKAIVREMILDQADQMAKESFLKINQEASTMVESQVSGKVRPALNALLPDDTKSVVIDLAEAIIQHRIEIHMKNWLTRHVSRGCLVFLVYVFTEFI